MWLDDEPEEGASPPQPAGPSSSVVLAPAGSGNPARAEDEINASQFAQEEVFAARDTSILLADRKDVPADQSNAANANENRKLADEGVAHGGPDVGSPEKEASQTVVTAMPSTQENKRRDQDIQQDAEAGVARGASPPPAEGAAAAEPLSIPRSNKSAVSTTSRKALVGEISILTFDRTRRHPPLMNSPRTLLACRHEGLDPNEDFVAKELKDFLFGCKGNREMAGMKLDHYNQRREQLISIVVNRREQLIEAVVKQQQQASASRARGDADGGKSDDEGSCEGSARDRRSPMSDEESSQRSGGRFSHRRPSRALLSRKEKALLSVERMQSAFERKLERQKQDEERAAQLRQQMKEQEDELRLRQEAEQRQQRVREALNKRKEEEARLQREQREQEMQAKQEAMRKEREQKAETMIERERQLKQRQEQAQTQLEYEIALKQKEVEDRLEERRKQAEEAALERRRQAEQKMSHAELLREKLLQANLAQLEAKKVESTVKAEQSQAKRQKVRAQEEEKLLTYAEKAKAVEAQQEKIQQERENYMLHMRLEEAKKEQLRREILRRVEEEEKRKEMELEERVNEADERTAAILAEKQYLTDKRRVEKELVLDDRLKQQQRLRRVQEHQREAVLAKIDEKQRRIELLQQEKVEDELARRKVQVSILRQTKKKPAARTPGPGDYGVAESFEALNRHDGMKLCTAGRPAARADESPGPGQYTVSLPRRRVGAKLPPKAKDLELLTAHVSMARGGSESSERQRLPSIARSPSSLSRRRSSTAPLVHHERPDGVLDEDYADSDEDFERVVPL